MGSAPTAPFYSASALFFATRVSGTTSKPAATFLAEEGLNFDNTATALGMTSRQYDGYLTAAGDLAAEAMANPAQRARFLICRPATAAEAPTGCAATPASPARPTARPPEE